MNDSKPKYIKHVKKNCKRQTQKLIKTKDNTKHKHE